MEAFLFKAEPSRVTDYNQPSKIKNETTGLVVQGIDPTSLTKLESILTRVDFFHIYQRGDYRVIHRNDASGAMFISSSRQLASSLKNIAEDEKDEIIDQWCSSQEVSLYGWSKDKARKLLNWLIAEASRKSSVKEQFILFVDKYRAKEKDPELITQ